jgi:hypothetical protein
VAVISDELRQFLEGPNSIVVGTQDGRLIPEAARALVLRCGADGDSVTLWLPVSEASRTVTNVAIDQRIAVAVELPALHKTRQLKGVVTKVGNASVKRRAMLDAAFEAFTEQCLAIGLPRRLLDRVVRWPATEVAMRVTSVFDQTPGPGAGALLGGAP